MAPGFMTLVKPSENRADLEAPQFSLLLTGCLSSAPSPSFPIQSLANLGFWLFRGPDLMSLAFIYHLFVCLFNVGF